MHLLEYLQNPWPWYVAGPLLGLTVPILLIMGNRSFGVSSSLRHICAACFPANLPFFTYNWRQQVWNLFFVSGIVIGGFIAVTLLKDPAAPVISGHTRQVLSSLGIRDFSGLLPGDLFSASAIFSARGLLFPVLGGFLVGFGTRYAGGCTSGHSIMGLSNLQWPSLVATICFMAGGIFTTQVLLPVLLQLVL